MAKKKEKKKAPKPKKGEKVYEIFKVEKDGEEKTIKSCGIDKEKVSSEKENKLLKNFLIWMGVAVLILVCGLLILNSLQSFEYKNIKFDVIKEGDVIFYHTVFPIYSPISGGVVGVTDYNIYLRNDPRQLERTVPFKGEMNLREMMVFETTEDFVCSGDGGIAAYNLQQIFNAFGTKMIQDPNANCGLEGDYMFVKLQAGDKTEIEQFSSTCYKLNINNCEVLDVTERFILEALKKVKK